MKKTISNKAKLAKLNKLYREQKKLSEKIGAEYRKVQAGAKSSTKDFDALTKKCLEIANEFDDLRRDMPRVKFDMAAGKYFYADAGHGEEMFAIKVKRNDCFYVTLSAKSAGEAMDRAKQIVAEQNGVPLVFLDAEDYSR